MDKYLNVLKQIQDNKWNKRYANTLASIEKYILGQITPSELLSEVPNSEKNIIYKVINKLLNYKERDIRYYIELPQDLFFCTKGKKCILAGKVNALNIDYNELKTIGPKVIQENSLEFIDKHYIEITGDFSNYPDGVILYESDWYKIIAKYPKIHELIYQLTKDDFELNYRFENMTRDESYKRVDEEITYKENLQLNMQIINEDATHLPQHTIDSIEFVIPTEYLSVSEIKNGNLRTFEQIVKSKEDGYINISLEDLVEFYYNNSITYSKFLVGLELDLSFLTDSTLNQRNKVEKIILLAIFLLKYKGVDADSHLYWFKDKDVVNGRICDIPLIEFAKLNNEELAQIFADLDISETVPLKNNDLVIQIAKQLEYDEAPRRNNK